MSLVLFSSVAFARQPNGAELQRAVDRLGVVGRVLYVAAHPDDENTRLLAWLVHDRLLRAGYLSLTRGEGGQNLIGAEQAPLLGVIRTQELLAARSLDGAEQWFGLERDFGYSKSPDETLKIWDHDAALGDVVWAIRRFRPDVIVTRFSPELTDTHGHHTASARLALEAFKAAADPKAYPEQLKLVAPWQARRIVWNKGVWPGNPPGDLTGFIQMDVGGYDAVLGASFGELAARSRSMHKSQGFGASPQRGPALEYFHVLAGDSIKQSFLDGVDLSWRRVKGAEKLQALLEKARAAFRPEHPADSIPVLLAALDALDALPENPYKAEKRDELTNVIAGCAGLYADAVADDFVAVPGGDFKVTLNILNRSAAPLTLKEVRLAGHVIEVGKPLTNNKPIVIEHSTRTPEAPWANPYWLVNPPSAGRWSVGEQMLVGLPEQPAPFQAEFVIEAGSRHFTVTRAVDFAWNDPVAGERRRPLEILPPLTIDPAEPLYLFPDPHAKTVKVKVHATAGAVRGELKAAAPDGWTIDPPSRPFELAKKGDELVLSFNVRPPAPGADSTASLDFSATTGDVTVTTGVHRIEYPHIPIQTLSPPAKIKLVRLTVKRGGNHIGYIAGAGDDVPAALRQVGYEVTAISDEALAHEPLGRFDAIVTGVRAFNVNPKLAGFHSRLMEYVSNGGILLMQYNTQNRISRIAGELGPYPFNISQDRVTDESAPITLGNHALLRAPNVIGAADFSGWVQERGLYFADKWDDHYQPLLTLNDPGESPKHGGLLFARHGKGSFVYTGIAFFRQLPAGVPGAFRLFANLLTHGQ